MLVLEGLVFPSYENMAMEHDICMWVRREESPSLFPHLGSRLWTLIPYLVSSHHLPSSAAMSLPCAASMPETATTTLRLLLVARKELYSRKEGLVMNFNVKVSHERYFHSCSVVLSFLLNRKCTTTTTMMVVATADDHCHNSSGCWWF